MVSGREGLPVMDVMPISEVIARVAEICKVNGVKRLELFGSFANADPKADFVLEGTVLNGISWRMIMTELLLQRSLRIS